MGRIYLRSKKIDKTSLDTEASNMIKDIMILCGIFDKYNRYNMYKEPTFCDYYLNILSVPSNRPNCRFVGEYYYYNLGVRIFRNLASEKTITTYGRRIKKICSTYRTKSVCIPKNTDALLYVLFEYIFQNDELKYIFINKILIKCRRYTVSLNNYPYDCSNSILGFAGAFLNNINLFSYSINDKKVANNIKKSMDNIIKNYKIRDFCLQRKC